MAEYENVVKKLIKKNYHISFAESCTGGLCASALVSVPDASKVFSSSYVTYSNESKIRLLHVKSADIDKYGVVSEEIAAQMAQGAAIVAGADVGIGITGIAGPTGATQNKPIGMVCFGIIVKDEVKTFTRQFGELGRNNVRQASVNFVFETLNNIL